MKTKTDVLLPVYLESSSLQGMVETACEALREEGFDDLAEELLQRSQTVTSYDEQLDLIGSYGKVI